MTVNCADKTEVKLANRRKGEWRWLKDHYMSCYRLSSAAWNEVAWGQVVTQSQPVSNEVYRNQSFIRCSTHSLLVRCMTQQRHAPYATSRQLRCYIMGL